MMKEHLGPIKLVNAAMMGASALLLFYQEDAKMSIMVGCFFIAMLSMSSICLQHRVYETSLRQKQDMICLKALGYDLESIKHIARHEV